MWQEFWTWTLQHQQTMLIAAILSAVFFVIMIAATPILIALVPYDYFQLKNCERKRFTIPNFLFHVGKNILGVIFFLLGFLMLFLPGQGILTILLSLMFLDFPKKKHLERWIVQKPVIFDNVNRIRLKLGKEPFVL